MKLFGTFVSVVLAAPAVYDYTAQSTAGSVWDQGVCQTGTGQSPIDVDESNLTTVTEEFDKFTFVNYENPHKWTVKNTGHGVKIVPDVEDMTFTGGAFSEEYKLAQFHFHWGQGDGQGGYTGGSEHTFNGNHYFSEVHFVHYKSSHSDLSAAVASGNQDDLAVLGFWLEIDDSIDEGPFDYLITDIVDDKVQAYNNVTETNEVIFWSANHIIDTDDVDSFSFYRYDGGLTTPTCNEIVTWTVFKDTIKIKAATAAKMTTFSNDNQGALVNNFRETQDLNGRAVKFYDGSLAKDPSASTTTPTTSNNTEKKSKVDAKVAFGMLPVSFEDPLSGEVSTVMKPVQKIIMCFTNSDLCMFQ